MKALLLREYRRLELAELPAPEIGPHDVLVRVAACGICGSDVHGFDGSTGRRIPPVVMGHEAAGTVAAAGSEVRSFREGDRVTFDSMISCSRCAYCRAGKANLCDDRRVLGVSCDEYRQNGAFAEYVAVPEHIVFALPEGLSFEQAALVEPVSVAIHAVNRMPTSLADSAVVVGAGMIGLLVVQALRASGCAHIIAIDLDETRLERARRMGADHGLNPILVDAPREVMALTGGGADVAFECVGATAPIDTAIASLRKGGALSLVGNVSPRAELPLQAVVTRELTLLGSCASNGEYPACLELIRRGAIDLAPLITAVAPLEEGPSWFDRLYQQEPGLMKVILQP